MNLKGKIIGLGMLILIYCGLQDGCDLPQARIVFDVTLEGSARKLITVRSALLLYNQLELPIEVKLENTPTVYSRGECCPHCE